MKSPCRRSYRWASAATLAVALFTGCGIFRGAVNDSPAIRWWLFSNFGAQRVCSEMLKRGAALTLVPEGESVGRFFPASCLQAVDDQKQTLTVQFAGTGYAWTPVAGRIGFQCDVTVEYRPDFFLDEDAIYVWASTNRLVAGPIFSVLSIENPVVDWAAQGPAAYLTQTFGQQIITSKLSQGFTVVRSDTGDDFSLGILLPPARPPRPFSASGERLVVANETTKIHAGQLDFLGPIEVTDADQQLRLHYRLAGPRAEAFLFQRQIATQWREQLQRGGPVMQPPGQWITGLILEPGESQAKFKLAPGQYMLVVDHSAAFGSVNPPWNPLAPMGSGAVSLSYILELDED